MNVQQIISATFVGLLFASINLTDVSKYARYPAMKVSITDVSKEARYPAMKVSSQVYSFVFDDEKTKEPLLQPSK